MINNKEKMTEEDIALFHDSYDRCTANPQFMDRFYELFLSSRQEVAEKYKYTDFKRQKKLHKESLLLVMLMNMDSFKDYKRLEKIAKHHSRKELNIRPGLYEIWLECLIQAVKEIDNEFNEK